MKIRYCIFQLRFPGVPKERFYDYYAKILPKSWEVTVIDREPDIPKNTLKHITAYDMYAHRSYSKSVTPKEIKELERWLGQSFSSIMSMEDAYFKTSFKPTRKRRENIARHVRFFRDFIIEKKINFCCVGYPNNILAQERWPHQS